MRRYKNEEFMDTPDFLFRAFRGTVPESIAPHVHEFVELVYVAEGSGRHL